MTQIDSLRFRIAKADHAKALELFTEILGYQRSHPGMLHYFLSRTYCMAADDNPDEEIWMFIDEYDDREAYMSSLLNAQKTDPTSV